MEISNSTQIDFGGKVEVRDLGEGRKGEGEGVEGRWRGREEGEREGQSKGKRG